MLLDGRSRACRSTVGLYVINIEKLDTDRGDERPWEAPGVARRDCDPHRGGVLLLLGSIRLVLGVLSLFTLLPSLIGLPLGLSVCIMAERDQKKMIAGFMDPTGEDQTEKAFSRGLYGMMYSICCWMYCPIPLAQFLR